MLSGMLPITSGDASIYGHLVSKDMVQIRKIFGVCPQYDILYDSLTVEEHLELFCAIKEVAKDKWKHHITEMIEQVGLTEKRNVRAGALSGGQKRKLSVAIALLGDSKIVFLDEPTRYLFFLLKD